MVKYLLFTVLFKYFFIIEKVRSCVDCTASWTVSWTIPWLSWKSTHFKKGLINYKFSAFFSNYFICPEALCYCRSEVPVLINTVYISSPYAILLLFMWPGDKISTRLFLFQSSPESGKYMSVCSRCFEKPEQNWMSPFKKFIDKTS